MGPSGGGGASGGQQVLGTLPGSGDVEKNLGSLAASLQGFAANGGAGTPGAWAYPQAQGLTASQFSPGSPGALGAQAGANTAGNFGWDLFNTMSQYPGMMGSAAAGGLPYLGAIMGNAFNPAYGQMTNAAMGTGAQLGSAGNQILNQGFDPQSALFNRSQSQLMDQANVANSMAGVGNTPYGASTMANALGNFDINWQNNLLNRESTAAGAANPLLQASIGLPLGALNAQNMAGIQGASGFGSLLGSTGAGLQGAQNLGNTVGQGLAGMTGLPYSTGATIGQNAMGSLGNAVNLGNQQFNLPQQLIGDYLQYLGMGPSVASASGQLSNNSFNQLSSGIGGGLGFLGSGMGFGSPSNPGWLSTLFSAAPAAAVAF